MATALPLIDAPPVDYGPNEEAMVRYRTEGTERARALGQLEAYACDLYPWLSRGDRARFFEAYLEASPEWRERRRVLARAAVAWADRRLEEWSRKDRSDHHHYPMGPRGAPGAS